MIQLKDSKNSISESFEKKLLFAIILTVFNYSGPSNHLFGNFQGLFPCVVNLSSKIPKMCHNICPVLFCWILTNAALSNVNSKNNKDQLYVNYCYVILIIPIFHG